MKKCFWIKSDLKMLTFQEEKPTMDILKFKRDQNDANNNNNISCPNYLVSKILSHPRRRERGATTIM